MGESLANERPPLVSPGSFISYAQNGEDVVLSRVLTRIPIGTYVDVGANHPLIDSVSRSFYNRGWSGLAIEPNPSFASMFRVDRPRDTVIEAAITDIEAATATFHLIEGTGLSTLVDSISAEHAERGFTVTDVTVPTMRLDTAIEQAGLSDTDIHFLLIDAEGAEQEVLRSIDFFRHRPWILVIEATSPRTSIPAHDAWESIVLDAGYEFCLFDGLSRFYVSHEKSKELKPLLSYPACALDDYITDGVLRLNNALEAARAELRSVAEQRNAAEHALSALAQSRSWRITRPLRTLTKVFRRVTSR